MSQEIDDERMVIISAFSDDAGGSYRFWYGDKNFEFIDKNIAKFVESSNGTQNFGRGIESRYFEMPFCYAAKLKGLRFYGGDLDTSGCDDDDVDDE